MSIEDEDTAKQLSLYAALLEVYVRVVFYVDFVKAGMEGGGKMMTHDECIQYVTRGKLRVSDAENDMQVEYVSTIAAAAVMLTLPKTGAFVFPSSNVSDEQILSVTQYQLVLEIIVDFACSFIENYGGLSKLHLQYWSFQTGRLPGSPFYKGDLVRGLVWKCTCVVLLTGMMFIVATKDE